MLKDSKLLILGFIAGFCSASLGIGGGVVLVPALIFFFKYDIKKAIGTTLATIVVITLVGATTHYIINSSNIKFLIVLFIVLGSVLGAKIGATLANKMSGKALEILFAGLLLLVGLELMGVIQIPIETASTTSIYPLLIILGLIAGTTSALFGIGGGVVMVPALNLFFGLSMHEAIATSLIVILPTSFAGAVFHRQLNNVSTETIKFLIPTALVGAISGAIISNVLSSSILKVIFGVVMILCAAKLLLKTK